MDRKFERDATRLADAFSYPVRKFKVMPVAGRKIRAGLCDPDDWLAGLQLLALDPPVHVALEVKRSHIGVFRIREPLSGAYFRGIPFHVLCHIFCSPRNAGCKSPGRHSSSSKACILTDACRCGIPAAPCIRLAYGCPANKRSA